MLVPYMVLKTLSPSGKYYLEGYSTIFVKAKQVHGCIRHKTPNLNCFYRHNKDNLETRPRFLRESVILLLILGYVHVVYKLRDQIWQAASPSQSQSYPEK